MQFSSYYASKVVIYDRKYVYKIGHWTKSYKVFKVKNFKHSDWLVKFFNQS